MKKNLLVAFMILVMFGFWLSACRTTDVVTITDDGWRIHSNVPVDTNGTNQTEK